MNIESSTIREILVNSEEHYGDKDAFRFKAKSNDDGDKKTIVVSKTYSEFKNDTEKFSKALHSIGETNTHIALLGSTSYEWIVSYMGIVNGKNVCVPLDAQLPKGKFMTF